MANMLGGFVQAMPANFQQVSAFPTHPIHPPPIQEQALHQGPDPNSPEIFKQNIQHVRSQVERVQTLARATLAGIQHAYHPGSNPTQSEANIASLKQALQLLCDMMRYTGVDALPLLPLPTGVESAAQQTVPTEQQMIADTTRAVQAQYERLKRIQDGAAIAANLLSAQDTVPRPGK